MLPFYLSRDILQEFEEGELEFGDEDFRFRAFARPGLFAIPRSPSGRLGARFSARTCVQDLKEEIRKELTDVGIDEWTYLDNFFKRYNKARCRVLNQVQFFLNPLRL